MKTQSESQTKAQVFLVDDHPIVRHGIGLLINGQSDMMVCGEASCVSEALQGITNVKTDVVVTDLSLKNSSGLDLIKDLQIRFPKLPVLVLSMHSESFYAERVLRAGARGYVTKEDNGQNVVDGIRRLLQGEVYLSEKVASRILCKLVGGKPISNKPSIECLTDRELQVFEMIGAGLGTREIAEELHLSVKTIESHREHIKDKLRIDNATSLLKQAIQWAQWERTDQSPPAEATDGIYDLTQQSPQKPPPRAR